jgi:hypothetical protein
MRNFPGQSPSWPGFSLGRLTPANQLAPKRKGIEVPGTDNSTVTLLEPVNGSYELEKRNARGRRIGRWG